MSSDGLSLDNHHAKSGVWVGAGVDTSFEYTVSTSGIGESDIGQHQVCFLTTNYINNASDAGCCQTYKNGLTWILRASSSVALAGITVCKAICLE